MTRADFVIRGNAKIEADAHMKTLALLISVSCLHVRREEERSKVVLFREDLLKRQALAVKIAR